MKIEDMGELQQLAKQEPAEVLAAYQSLWHMLSESEKSSVSALRLLEQLADLSFQLKQWPASQAYWQELCQRKPVARFFNNLGGVYLVQGEVSRAVEQFEQALHLQPDLWSAQLQLALIWLRSRPELAIRHIESLLQTKAEQLIPLASNLFQVALKLIQSKQLALADRYLAVSCHFPNAAPDVYHLHSVLASRAHCAQSQGQTILARDFLSQAVQQSPDPVIYAWTRLNTLPYIYANQAEIEHYRQDYQLGLVHLAETLNTPLNEDSTRLLLSTLRAPFLLAYQGQNDRELMSQIGQIWSGFLARQDKFVHCHHTPGQQRRIQVAFVSSHFYGHSVSLCFAELIKQLAREPDFDVTCIHLRAHSDDHTRDLKAQVQRFIQITGPVSVQELLNLKLDVLIYTDIGMDYQAYQLALHRLAPIQCVLPGHPVTSGLPQIDYYLSSPLCEPDDAQAHYSEKLILLQNELARYPQVKAPGRLWSRSELGLPDDQYVYFCPMTLFKLHPDFDQALLSILEQDPQALIYFCEYQGTELHRLLQKRFQLQMGSLAARIRFLPWLDPERFYSLILQADAVLDSFHFGGGSTSRMVLGLGQALVTWPGQFFRGRISYGCYQRMGLAQYCALNVADYVSQALKLAHDLAYRHDLQKQIQARLPLLFEQLQQTSQLAVFLREAIATHLKKH